jgi:hypothetical protein
MYPSHVSEWFDLFHYSILAKQKKAGLLFKGKCAHKNVHFCLFLTTVQKIMLFVTPTKYTPPSGVTDSSPSSVSNSDSSDADSS